MKRARAADLPAVRSTALYSLSGKLLDVGRTADALELACEAYEIARSQSDQWRLALTACRLGSILAALGRPGVAALAYSAGMASLEEMGGVALHRAEEDRQTLDRLHEELGDSFEERWEAGRRLAFEEAIELALAEATADA